MLDLAAEVQANSRLGCQIRLTAALDGLTVARAAQHAAGLVVTPLGHLDGVPAGGRVVVAMSGGVDSSVTAALLAEAGYEVVGVTLQLYDHGAASGRKGACCAGRDIHDAREVATRLGIAALRPRLRGPLQGGRDRRFRRQLRRGPHADPLRALQRADQVPRPSGHRPRPGRRRAGHRPLCRAASPGPDGPELHRAADPAKDQSYFLFATTRGAAGLPALPAGRPRQGRRPCPRPAPGPRRRRQARQPGHLLRAQRSLQRRGGPPAARRASQPGEIVHVDGRVLGRHDGTARFTVGQRRGLHVADGERLYVVGIEPERRRVVVGPRHAGDCARLQLDGRQLAGRSRVGHDGGGQAPLQRARRPRPDRAPARRPRAGRRSTSRSPAWPPARPASATPARRLARRRLDRPCHPRLAVGAGPAQRLTPRAPAHR